MQIELAEAKPKTQVYHIVNVGNRVLLGIVKWYPDWSQYAFFPEGDRVFSKGCIKDIHDFIQQLMNLRKKPATHNSTKEKEK